MKFRVIFLAIISSLLISCGGKKTRVTVVTESADSVRFVIGGTDFDVKTAANETFECPVNDVEIATAYVDNVPVYFVSDGSNLTIKHPEEGSMSYIVESDKSGSVNHDIYKFMSEFEEESEGFENLQKEWFKLKSESMKEDNENNEELKAKVEKAEEAVRNEFERLKGVEKEFVENNLNSVAALFPLQKMIPAYDDDEFEELASKFDKKLKSNSYVKNRLESIENTKATAEGEMFTDFTVEESEGVVKKLSDYVGKGKYVVVDFWASWCGPCRGEIPNLVRIYNKYRGDDFNVLGVAVCDKPEASKKAAGQLGINYDEIINAGDVPVKLYGINGIPEIILFGPDGTILKRGLRGSAIEKEVAKYVKPNESE